jgi:hypothetical protein
MCCDMLLCVDVAFYYACVVGMLSVGRVLGVGHLAWV